MLTRLRTLILSLTLIITMAAPSIAVMPLAASVASAQGTNGCGNNDIANNVAQGASKAASTSTSTISCSSDENGSATTTLENIAHTVVNIFSIVVGAVSIIMIIYGGFRYITSGGSSESVGNAKNVIIYAIIGLIIVALAQVIVHFVLSAASQNANGF